MPDSQEEKQEEMELLEQLRALQLYTDQINAEIVRLRADFRGKTEEAQVKTLQEELESL